MLLILHPLFSTARHQLSRVGGAVLVVAFITHVFAATVDAENIAPIALEAPILPDDDVASTASSVVTKTAPVGTAVAPEAVETSFTVAGCSSCGSIGCGGCNTYCGPGFRPQRSGSGMWVRADYLLWYEKDSDVVPLVTTSTGITTVPDDLLTLEGPGTSTLFGGQDYDDNPLDGFRIEIGSWLDAGATHGIFGRFFELGDRNTTFSAGPDDFNFLGIPFFDPDIDAEDAVDLTVPNERRGLVNVSLDGDVKNWELLVRRNAQSSCNYRMDWVYGYHNFSLDETLRLEASTLVTNASAGVVNTRIDITDQFDVENRYHGIDLGVIGQTHQGRWSMDYLLKIGLGVTEHEVDVSGSQVISVPALDVQNNVGGLFSQESNIGKTDESNFTVIPEFNVNIGYGITKNLDFTVGYTFLYVSSVIRAGTVIDRTVDPGLAVDLDPVNSNRPLLNFDDEGYFLHGLNLGLTARY